MGNSQQGMSELIIYIGWKTTAWVANSLFENRGKTCLSVSPRKKKSFAVQSLPESVKNCSLPCLSCYKDNPTTLQPQGPLVLHMETASSLQHKIKY